MLKVHSAGAPGVKEPMPLSKQVIDLLSSGIGHGLSFALLPDPISEQHNISDRYSPQAARASAADFELLTCGSS